MDPELRFQILRALIKDILFLKESAQNVSASIFTEKEENLVAQAALTFYEKYHEPIGGMIRSDTDTLAGREHYSPEARKKLKTLLDHLLGGKMELISVEALGDRVKALKKYQFYTQAVEEILQLEHTGKLDASSFEKIVERANAELNSGKLTISDLKTGAKTRVLRRLEIREDPPKLFIDALDGRCSIIGRGQTGLVLAPLNSGKGLFLVHIDIVYALQGLKVLHITLEDPLDVVEDRLDACLTRVSMNNLVSNLKEFIKRFKARRKYLKGEIKVVDGTGTKDTNTWTIAQVERVWRDLAREGFVADAIIIDYDDYLAPSRLFKGENAKRFESDDIYRGLTQLAAKLNVIIWTAAQGTRKSIDKWVVTSIDVAEDISKLRKVFFAISIGSRSGDPKKHLYVCRHRTDRSKFGVNIVGDYDNGIFYNRRESAILAKEEKEKMLKEAAAAKLKAKEEAGE